MKKIFSSLLICFFLFGGMQLAAQCPDEGETELSLSVTTDNWGSETTWTLTSADGTILSAGGPYQNNAPQTFPATACVEIGTAVSFTINDSNGDGICCNSGNGSYSISIFDTEVASGGEFGDQEIVVIPVVQPAANGANLLSLKMGSSILSGLHDVRVRVKNSGTESLSALGLSWTSADVSADSEATGLNIAPGAEADVVHPNQWLAAPGAQSITVDLTSVNGSTDFTSGSPSVSGNLLVAESLAQRQALVEHFTNVNFPTDAVQNPVLWAVINGAANVATVSYHTDNNGDPFYEANPSDNSARAQYYGTSSSPEVVLNGDMGPGQIADLITPATLVEAASAPAGMGISLTESLTGSVVSVEASVTPFVDSSNPNLRLFVALVEKDISLASAPGTNGETNFNYVMRKLLPTNQGQPLGNLSAGSTISNTVEYSVGSDINLDNLYTVAWVQDVADKRVMQAFISPAASGTNSGVGNTQNNLFTVVDAACGDGSITVEQMPGFSDLTFAWTDAEDKAIGSGPTISATPGTYTLTAEGAGQTISYDISIGGIGGSPNISVVDYTWDEVTMTGGASVEVFGPGEPYSVTWPDGTVGATNDGLANGEYEVVIQDANGCTFPYEVAVGAAAGLDEFVGLTMGRLYPNPTNGMVNMEINLVQSHDVTVQLMDMNGRLVDVLFQGQLSQGSQSLQFHIGNQIEGMYFVRITDGQQQVVQPLILK